MGLHKSAARASHMLAASVRSSLHHHLCYHQQFYAILDQDFLYEYWEWALCCVNINPSRKQFQTKVVHEEYLNTMMIGHHPHQDIIILINAADQQSRQLEQDIRPAYYCCYSLPLLFILRWHHKTCIHCERMFSCFLFCLFVFSLFH